MALFGSCRLKIVCKRDQRASREALFESTCTSVLDFSIRQGPVLSTVHAVSYYAVSISILLSPYARQGVASLVRLTELQKKKKKKIATKYIKTKYTKNKVFI